MGQENCYVDARLAIGRVRLSTGSRYKTYGRNLLVNYLDYEIEAVISRYPFKLVTRSATLISAEIMFHLEDIDIGMYG